MKAIAGRIIYETLKSYGVPVIFGMEDPIHIFHAVDPKATRIVTIRDEKHGAIMAHGYAQVTGKVGVCAATFGPGTSNLATGLYEAHRSSVPVIALVQDHPLRVRQRNANSELDHARAMAPFVKDVLRIDLPEQAGDKVRAAMRLATSGRPGPIALLCPTDVIATETEASTHAEAAFMRAPALRTRAEADGLRRAAELLAAAKLPLIVAGGGAMISGAFEEVRRLAERFAAPTATTLTGRGLLPDGHPLALGPIGNQAGGQYGRSRIANTIAGEADVVVLLGTKTGQLAYGDWKLFRADARIVHLDIDPAELGRNFPTEVALAGDVRDSLRELLAIAEASGLKRADPGNGGRIASLREEWRARIADRARSAATPIRPERLIAEIDRVVDASTVIVADASYSTAWALSHIDMRGAQRTIISPRGTGSIGWGFSAAIGAKLGAPERPVISISGDGGFGYAIAELETAARHRVALTVVVLNNSTLAYQRHWEQKSVGAYRDCDFVETDFAAIARAMGCAGERITDPEAIAPALARARAATRPHLLDVVIDPQVAGPVAGMDGDGEQSESH